DSQVCVPRSFAHRRIGSTTFFAGVPMGMSARKRIDPSLRRPVKTLGGTHLPLREGAEFQASPLAIALRAGSLCLGFRFPPGGGRFWAGRREGKLAARRATVKRANCH